MLNVWHAVVKNGAPMATSKLRLCQNSCIKTSLSVALCARVCVCVWHCEWARCESLVWLWCGVCLTHACAQDDLFTIMTTTCAAWLMTAAAAAAVASIVIFAFCRLLHYRSRFVICRLLSVCRSVSCDRLCSCGLYTLYSRIVFLAIIIVNK